MFQGRYKDGLIEEDEEEESEESVGMPDYVEVKEPLEKNTKIWCWAMPEPKEINLGLI